MYTFGIIVIVCVGLGVATLIGLLIAKMLGSGGGIRRRTTSSRRRYPSYPMWKTGDAWMNYQVGLSTAGMFMGLAAIIFFLVFCFSRAAALELIIWTPVLLLAEACFMLAPMHMGGKTKQYQGPLENMVWIGLVAFATWIGCAILGLWPWHELTGIPWFEAFQEPLWEPGIVAAWNGLGSVFHGIWDWFVDVVYMR